ncbi:acyl-CoA dehydrogenase [uncultured Agrococcus sp.]|uniref:acyl-CoA dehydrogenase family protein n=1 Tax=uncultured Agrococcus sp. TaxID=382258 RepID=UPI0025F80778|nr:acyl-CoA dehydrogenase [uncultured Agrococcus sp.]
MSRIDVEWLGRDLLGRWSERRLAGRAKAADPKYQRIPNQTMEEHRERVFEQMGHLSDDGAVRVAFPESVGGASDHGGNIAGFEELFLADPSLQIKSGVQYGLFAAAIMHLGTQDHHERLLPGAVDLTVPGAFAMTEKGHGSDVASVGTTATYDTETEEFIVHTPFPGATKEFLGNAALHGKAAVVFAQLITQGVNHGVHAFYVPVRSDAGELLDGVESHDDGFKNGLNGIDNGGFTFTQVRIPRNNLLNRYGDVTADGTYSSPIDSPGRRFFTMLGTLVQGRVSLDGSAVVASKAALSIAIRYALQRRQFNASSDTREELLLDYRSHQRRLFTRLAKTYAISYAHEELLQHFHGVFSGEEDTPENREDLETLAAGLKSLSTWHGLDTLQECREACGGAGYIAENRFGPWYEDLDVYTTFEGDNTVLLQLVGKRLLGDFAKQFKGASAASLAQFAAKEFAGRAAAQVGLHVMRQDLHDFGSPAKASLELRNTKFQQELFADRVETMVADIASRLRKAPRDDQAKAAAMFNNEQNQLLEAARAWTELQQLNALNRALERMDGETLQIMTYVRDLFALTVIEEHAGWYLENGRLSGQRSKAVTSTIERLLQRLRPHAADLVDAFGYGDEILRSPIATDAEGERQREAVAYYDRLRASGELPVTEKELRERAKREARAAEEAERTERAAS